MYLCPYLRGNKIKAHSLFVLRLFTIGLCLSWNFTTAEHIKNLSDNLKISTWNQWAII